MLVSVVVWERVHFYFLDSFTFDDSRTVLLSGVLPAHDLRQRRKTLSFPISPSDHPISTLPSRVTPESKKMGSFVPKLANL